MSKTPLRLGIPQGAYPERQQPPVGWFDQACAQATGGVVRALRNRQLQPQRLLRAVTAYGKTVAPFGMPEIKATADSLRYRLRREGLRPETVAWAFALIREVAHRLLGMRHFDVQLIGGWVLLHGMVAEMETGEGKTLVATLPACTAALAGIPVHVITVNDYLAHRDAEWMEPVYHALGLTVGVIMQGMDPATRHAAYACDITYCTNKEVAFDYLKDRIVLGRNAGRLHLQLERLGGERARLQHLLLRGLCYAIVDEADSVLVDEARTPLIISGAPDHAPEQQVYQTALDLAAQLEPPRDFVLASRERSLQLTPAGQERLTDLAQMHRGVWTGRRRREELVRQALTALHEMQRDIQYLVRDGKVQIIDEFTGRVMGDRSWEHGLHQLIETKEGCTLTGLHEPLARISYQRFFRRYLRLAGMTGTAREVRNELWSVYRLPVVTVPTNRPVQRRSLGTRLYKTADTKWQAVVARIVSMHQSGRPLLVGTRSVAASEHLSTLLTAAGLPHQVLNARQDQEEAAIIIQAGAFGRITVATNMAGRGTDIRLGPGVRELGGLHVIASEGHEAGRIDRQLFGRCGRQGDPGSYELLAALEDDLFTSYASWWWRGLATVLGRQRVWGGQWLCTRTQRTAEHTHARIRRDLLKVDEHLETALAFSGRLE